MRVFRETFSPFLFKECSSDFVKSLWLDSVVVFWDRLLLFALFNALLFRQAR